MKNYFLISLFCFLAGSASFAGTFCKKEIATMVEAAANKITDFSQCKMGTVENAADLTNQSKLYEFTFGFLVHVACHDSKYNQNNGTSYHVTVNVEIGDHLELQCTSVKIVP